MLDQELTIKIDLPPRITVRIWDAYQAGRGAYLRTAKVGSTLMTDYAGALALIKAQFVTVEAPQPFQDYLEIEKIDDADLAFIGLIVREISNKIEAAVNGPLPLKVTSSKPSSPTS